MVRNLYSFQQKQTLKTTCSSCILFNINQCFCFSHSFQLYTHEDRSTRFGTPLNLLAIGHQALSTPCVICQLSSCRRTRYFCFCCRLSIVFHCVKCAEMKVLCVVFNSRSYLILTSCSVAILTSIICSNRCRK